MKPLHFSAIATAQYAPDLAQQVHESLRPFVSYLNSAKRAAKQREAKSWVSWEPLPAQRQLKLEPLDSLLEIQGEGHLYLAVGFADPPASMPLFVGKQYRPVATLHAVATAFGVELTLAEEIDCSDGVFWAGRPCTLEPKPMRCPADVRAVRADATSAAIRLRTDVNGRERFVVEGRDPVVLQGADGVEILHRSLPPEDGATELRTLREVWGWNGERTLQLAALPKDATLTANNAVRWSWSEPQSRGRHQRGVWVQLLASEATDAEATMDPRAAYCDEGVRSVRTQKGGGDRFEFKVFNYKRENYQLELSELPPVGTQLFLPANLGAFNQQLNAVYRLKDAPLPHHRGLLRLCEDPARTVWPPVQPVTVADDEWRLLDTPLWDGTEEQREFVIKALGTQDFAFLEGPPGSGKTHAICELVLQLIERNERVLLCSTTHVAVDNVLERLTEQFPHVEAVRIGKAGRVDPRVRACQLDERVNSLVDKWRNLPGFSGVGERERDAMAEGAVLAAANLTCGTTTGILRHPYLNSGEEGRTPAWPHFDVLIVDEASKTTLQEFLVPAQLAKRWIIVGDVRQLPPFTEPKDLEASLAEISNDERGGVSTKLPDAYQRACLLLAHLEKDEAGARRVRWLIEEPRAVLDAFVAEVQDRAAKLGGGPTVVRILPRAIVECDVTLGDLEAGSAAALRVCAAHWILAPDGLFDAIERFLPPDVLRLRRSEEVGGHSYRHALWARDSGRLSPPLRIGRGNSLSHADHIQVAVAEFLAEQTWPKQLAWRLGRVHQLATAKNSRDRDSRQREIDALLPSADPVSWVATAVDAIRDVGVRSVLESLRVPRGQHRVRRRSCLTDALPTPVLDSRTKLLTRQHRMHPDIAAFPRKMFYDGQALLDANTLQARDAKVGWTFGTDEPGRRLWVDVVGAEERGANPAEVTAIEGILTQWRDWARTNRRRDGKPWEVACLTFYNRQETAIRDMLRRLTRDSGGETRFELPNTQIVCATVDRFQGREADVVFLSFRNTRRPGHADSPNRLNVAITRARFMLFLVGNRSYFAGCPSEELAELAETALPVHGLARRSP